jgi:hypothetical protein
MMQVMRDIGGVEIPETLATLAGVNGRPAADGQPAGDATPKHPGPAASGSRPPAAPAGA